MSSELNVPAAPYRVEDPRRVSTPLAMVLSLMPGLGQVYLGRYREGFRNALVAASLIAALNQGVGALEPLLGLFLAFFWMFNIVDAGRQAYQWNQAPEGTVKAVPDRTGALLTGLGLIALGLVTLLHKVLGFSMEWLVRWWPATLVVVGIVLVWQALNQDRPGDQVPQA